MVPNFPTALTWLRIVLIPVFVGIYYVPDEWLSPVLGNWVGMGVFALAAITDWFDGYVARSLKQTSAFGAFLDPVADKMMVAAALILLVRLGRAEAYLAIIIIGREIAIAPCANGWRNSASRATSPLRRSARSRPSRK
jgi:CDP-diacylglycerol--glycerol-3-phosphate 3-phosphatidyltransferase